MASPQAHGVPQQHLAVALALLMAVHSPSCRKYNQHCLQATHMNDFRLPNNCTALMTVMAVPHEGRQRRSRRSNLLDHLPSFQVVSVTELASLVVRGMSHTLYEPEVATLQAEAMTTPPLDAFLTPLVSLPLRKVALCMYSLCIQYAKLHYVVHVQGASIQQSKYRKARKWHLDFASEASFWNLGQSIGHIVSSAALESESADALSPAETTLYTTYVQKLFFKVTVDENSMSKRKYMEDSSDSQLEGGGGIDPSALGALSRKRRARVWSDHNSMWALDVHDPVQCAVKYSVKLGEFVLSARMVRSEGGRREEGGGRDTHREGGKGSYYVLYAQSASIYI